jgi:hypothetical protein
MATLALLTALFQQSILPVKTPLLFKQLNVAAVKKKITELNNSIKNDPVKLEQSLSVVCSHC